MLTHLKPLRNVYNQTEVVWDKNHYSMQVKGGLGMLTHLKPLRNEGGLPCSKSLASGNKRSVRFCQGKFSYFCLYKPKSYELFRDH